MGEITEMILEGILCQGCGVYIGDGIGYPRFCKECEEEIKRGNDNE